VVAPGQRAAVTADSTPMRDPGCLKRTWERRAHLRSAKDPAEDAGRLRSEIATCHHRGAIRSYASTNALPSTGSAPPTAHLRRLSRQSLGAGLPEVA
jgi:hypothetical protein